jgi:hypothetical protein
VKDVTLHHSRDRVTLPLEFHLFPQRDDIYSAMAGYTPESIERQLLLLLVGIVAGVFNAFFLSDVLLHAAPAWLRWVDPLPFLYMLVDAIENGLLCVILYSYPKHSAVASFVGYIIVFKWSLLAVILLVATVGMLFLPCRWATESLSSPSDKSKRKGD